MKSIKRGIFVVASIVEMWLSLAAEETALLSKLVSQRHSYLYVDINKHILKGIKKYIKYRIKRVAVLSASTPKHRFERHNNLINYPLVNR
jgi:uncharacterized membrane protein